VALLAIVRVDGQALAGVELGEDGRKAILGNGEDDTDRWSCR